MTLPGKISIVIPCFNCGSMLQETLASIERVRTDSLAEVIIVNDGSTDPVTCKIINDLDPREYIVVHQENRGPSRARNVGIEIARGEFILPIDGDDYLRRSYLDRGLAILIAEPEIGVVYGDVHYFGENSGRVSIAEFDWRTLVKGNYIAICALYRKSIWVAVGGYDEKMLSGHEDWDFWMRVGLRGWRFAHLNEIAFDYRVRTGSWTCETMQHNRTLVEYIFGKPEYRILRALREQGMQLDQLAWITTSWDYRIGRFTMTVPREMRRILRGLRRRLLRGINRARHPLASPKGRRNLS